MGEEGQEGLLLLQVQAEDSCRSSSNSNSNSKAATFSLVFSSFIAVSGSFAYGCASGYSSPAQSGIERDLDMSTAEYSIFGSLLTFGSMLGAIISGIVADFIGRRGAMLFLQLFFITGWLGIIFAKDAWWLDLGRFLLGFSNGLQLYVSVIYIAEITPKEFRGGFAMAIQLMVCGGVVLMFFMGNIVSWRILALIGTVPCLIQVIGVLFIPESPRWLAKVGLRKQLEASLRLLRGRDADISQEATQIWDSTRQFEEQPRSGLWQLVERRYARPLIVGIGLSLLVPWGGITGILFYASSIFAAAGCSVSLATTTISLVQIPFSVLGVLLMDKFGRRSLLMIDLAGACLGGALAGMAFILQYLKLDKGLTPTLVLVSMLIYFASFSFGAGLPSVIISEIFPMNIKGTAGSIAVFANCLSSWIVSYAFNFLFTWSSAGVFFLFAIICGLLIIFVAKMLPETKGLSLEEIQALWNQQLH